VKLTGGCAAAVLGVHPWESPLELWARLRGAPDRWAEQRRIGRAVEAGLLGMLGGATCKPDLQVAAPPWLAANPDGWARAALRVVKHAPWITPDEWAVEGPPRWLLACIQHELLATGATAARYAVLIGGASLKTGEMGPVPEFQADLLAAEGAFFKALEDGAPPAPTTDDDLDVVKRLWPDGDGREIALPPEAWKVWEGVKGARKVAGAAKKRQRLLEARLRFWLGAASVARVGRFRLGLRTVKTPNGAGRRLVELAPR